MPFCQARTRAKRTAPAHLAWDAPPTRSPVRGLELALAAVLALPMAAMPPWAQLWTRPLAARAAEPSLRPPLTASTSGQAVSPSPSPAGTATRAPTTEAAGGCRLSFGQMQRVARGNVLRLQQGDCVIKFNTPR